MRIIRCADYREMSRQAANLISAQVILKPSCVLGLATGSTPVGVYDQLAAWVEKKDLSFAEVSTVNLDEYLGLAPQDVHSYRYFMDTQLFDRVDVRKERTYVPDGLCADPAAECARYDALVEALGGIDLQLLGLGRNGHIGFNEPDDAFVPDTHRVKLTESTLAANRRFFEDAAQMPREALTLGIRHILQAKRVVVAASGAEKAEAVARAFAGPVTPRLPASILQLHPDVTLVADGAALRLLDEKGAGVP